MAETVIRDDSSHAFFMLRKLLDSTGGIVSIEKTVPEETYTSSIASSRFRKHSDAAGSLDRPNPLKSEPIVPYLWTTW
jgi:hypothetical protein